MAGKIFIFEGMDRCGKSSSIEAIRASLGKEPSHILHYLNAKWLKPDDNKIYSMEQYLQGFEMMKFAYDNNINLIFDRFHIGEYVYSPIYRKYSGEFIFEIEKQFKDEKFFENIFLTVIVDEAKNVVKREDGLSFSGKDIDLKISEKWGFITGFTKSNILHKQLINCGDFNCDVSIVVNEVKKGLNL